MEHRWGQRITTDLAVSLVAMPATISFGRMLNVSSTGAFVATRLSVPLLAKSGSYQDRRSCRQTTKAW